MVRESEGEEGALYRVGFGGERKGYGGPSLGIDDRGDGERTSVQKERAGVRGGERKERRRKNSGRWEIEVERE